MDKVQIYETGLLIVSGLIGLVIHGDEQENYDFRNWFLGFVVSLPCIGRIYGWW